MKTAILAVGALCFMLLGCDTLQNSAKSTIPSAPDTFGATLPDALCETYYLSPEEPVHAYLQDDGIQNLFNMWLKEYTEEDIEADWSYDTLARVQLLDHDLNYIARPGTELYTCTFSINDGRCGYLIVSYDEGEDGPHIEKWSLHESTPYLYDLRANSNQITAALKETDIDLSTASAVRVEWIDTDKNRGDRIILFTDGKDDKYIGYLGDEDFTIEKK